MKIKFRGKTLDIQNKSNEAPSRNFDCIWNGYIIEANKEPKEKVWWIGVYCPMGSTVVDGDAQTTLLQSIQYAFDNISYDIDEKRKIVDEYTQWLDLVKDFE